MQFVSLLSELSTGSRILDVICGFALIIVFLPLSTYCATTCLFMLQNMGEGGRGKGKEPPHLPYCIPYFANMFQMSDLHALYESVAEQSEDNRPVSLSLGSVKMYLVFGYENVQELFRSSKKLAKDGLTRQAFQNTGRGEESTIQASNNADKSKRIAQIDDAEAALIGKRLHDMQLLLLSQGTEVNYLTEKFVEVFQELLDQGLLGATTVWPIFDFLRNVMFKASTTALMGKQMIKLNPHLVRTYWEYDEAFLLGMPELMYPQGDSARDKFLAAVQKYVDAGHEYYDWDSEADPAWEENFGCRLFRSCIRELKERGIRKEDQAGAILSLVWATASNAIPCAAWALIEMIQRPDILHRVRSEVNSASVVDSDTGRVSFDLGKLSSLPLLNSVYLECLRIRSSITVTRKLDADLDIDGYRLKRGNYVMTPTWLPHTNANLWSDEEHGVKDFWPERFLQRPGLSQSSVDEKTEGRGHLATALKPENFFPYGGGSAICPGRFFSKQEILTAVALVVLKFDLEMVEYVNESGASAQGPPKPKQNYAGGGVMPPDLDLKVNIRRRDR